MAARGLLAPVCAAVEFIKNSPLAWVALALRKFSSAEARAARGTRPANANGK